MEIIQNADGRIRRTMRLLPVALLFLACMMTAFWGVACLWAFYLFLKWMI
jgi:hypothetical protein